MEIRTAGVDKKGKAQYVIKNNSSVEFMIRFEGGNPVVLKGLSSTFIKEQKAGQSDIIVDSAWCGEDKRLTIKIK